MHPPAVTLPSLPATRTLHSALAARGFEVGDFALEEAPTSALARMLGVPGGVLKVHCHSTGEERLYSTGAGSAWFGAFVMDLGKGHFAAAAREHAPARPPVSRHVPSRRDA